MSSSIRSQLDWGNYEGFPEALNVRLDEDPVKISWEVLPRTDALTRFEALMSERHQRVDMVVDLALRNGYAAGLDEDGLSELNRFLLENLPVNRAPDAGRGTELLNSNWVSVIWDLGLTLGESAIRRHPHLRWEFFDPKRRNTMGMHSPVLMGHREADPTMPFLHVEAYVSEICGADTAFLFEAKGREVLLPKPPVRKEFFRILYRAEDLFA